jgi:radical SAM superfamily enzyme YgiQ (UPF0313 family)
MKILLILSASENFIENAEIGKPNVSYAPTTLIHLASLVPEELSAEIECIDLAVKPLPLELDADLIGISTITCGVPEAYRIAKMAKDKKITVVLGGTHPTALPEEALLHADAVVIGQAETTWPQLLRDFAAGKLKRVYKESNALENGFRLVKLNRSLYKKGVYRFTDCIETTRGCPNSCRFCAVHTQHPCAAFRDVGDVTEEINSMGRNLLFLDSNHTEYTEYNKKLWPILKSSNKHWFCASSMRFASDAVRVKEAAESGLIGVLIGFESVNQMALAGMNKSFNSVENFYDSVKRLHDHGIIILGNFIFGFDEDDASVFDKTVEFAIKARIDIVRYAILTPLPNTPLFNSLDKEKRIIDYNWGHYDTDHVLFTPNKMSPEVLKSGLIRAYKDTYSFSSILQRIKWTGMTTALSIGGNLGFRQLFKNSILKN